MFYVGVAGLATSSVAGIVTTGSDMLANKFKTKKMKEVLEKSKEIEEKFEKSMSDLHEFAKKLLNEGICKSEDDAFKFLIGLSFHALNIGKASADAAPFISDVADALYAGNTFSDATQIAAAGGAATTSASKAGSLGASVISGLDFVSTATVFLGVFGTTIRIADVIYSWTKGNPCRNSAIEVLQKIEESLTHIKNLHTLLNCSEAVVKSGQ